MEPERDWIGSDPLQKTIAWERRCVPWGKAVKCTNCGAENPDGQRFCGGCGHGLEGPPQARLGLVICPNCGFDNPDGRRYCADCGSMIPRTSRTVTPEKEGKKKEG